MTGNNILINWAPYEVRAAVLEKGALAEYFTERTRKRTVVGNIYKGRVVKVLPGMQSAFVEIGLQKAAFLHVADMITPGEPDDAIDEDYEESLPVFPTETNEETETTTPLPPIEELIKEGQDIIVQVAKDASGNKGARLTMHLSIPGRYLVLMPDYEHIGVSRKIEESEERERLKTILKTIISPSGGLIARTVSRSRTQEELAADSDYLLRIWDKVKSVGNIEKSPSLLYEDGNLIYRLLRDVVNSETNQIMVDNKEVYEDIRSYATDYLPDIKDKIVCHNKSVPIFDCYNVEIEITKLLDRRVWLRSGGYIIIDQTEALTVIDVNTGRFVGKRNFEETILKTNIEAVYEIAHQLKLRNIGGIVIVDFIDMQIPVNRTKILEIMEELLKDDRSRASVINITPLGLVEITRKRAQESVSHMMNEVCPYCEGRGTVKSRLTVCYEILRQLARIAADSARGTLLVEAHNEIADILHSNEREAMVSLEKEFNISIEIKIRPHFHLEHYEIIPLESYRNKNAEHEIS